MYIPEKSMELSKQLSSQARSSLSNCDEIISYQVGFFTLAGFVSTSLSAIALLLATPFERLSGYYSTPFY